MKTVRMRATPSKVDGRLAFDFSITDEPIGTNPAGYYVGEVGETLTKGSSRDLACAIIASAEAADGMELN